METLLTPEVKRYTLFPIRYPQLWKSYKTQEACIWHTHEVDLTQDLKDWKNLNENERYFLKMVLAFFASSDIIVNENLAERFSKDVKILEAKVTYDFQKFMENIHSEMYSLLIDTYITDEREKTKLLNSVEDVPIVAKKADWARRWISCNESFAERLIAFSAVEGIFFSGSFCAIFWMKERKVLPGLCKSNDFISRDEGQHTDNAVLLYSMLQEKCSIETMHNIIREAVDLETEFIVNALPCDLLGMNAATMTEYIKFVANRLLTQYEYPELYPHHEECPFPFMGTISLKQKSNFFEKKPSEYNKKSTVEQEAEDPYAEC